MELAEMGAIRAAEDPRLASYDKRFQHRKAGAYTRSFLSSTEALLLTPPRVPLSNRLGETHATNVSHKMCLR